MYPWRRTSSIKKEGGFLPVHSTTRSAAGLFFCLSVCSFDFLVPSTSSISAGAAVFFFPRVGCFWDEGNFLTLCQFAFSTFVTPFSIPCVEPNNNNFLSCLLGVYIFYLVYLRSIKMASFSFSNLSLLLLQSYFLLMNFTVERSYCGDEFATNPTGFLIPETVAFCNLNNRLFLARPEWMVRATCVHSYIFPIG